MACLEYWKFVQWTMMVLIFAGTVGCKKFQYDCPLTKKYFCACSLTEKAVATPLKIRCFYKAAKGIECKPCSREFQKAINCSKCPGNRCQVCSTDKFGLKKSYNGSYYFSYISHPSQVFFSFSSDSGNLFYITPNSLYKMLLKPNSSDSSNPVHVLNGSEYFDNHEKSLTLNPNKILLKSYSSASSKPNHVANGSGYFNNPERSLILNPNKILLNPYSSDFFNTKYGANNSEYFDNHDKSLILNPNKIRLKPNSSASSNLKHVANDSEYFSNHLKSLILSPKDIIEILSKYADSGLFKIKGINVKSNWFIILDNNIAGDVSKLLRFQRSGETDRGAGASRRTRQINEPGSLNAYPGSSQDASGTEFRKFKKTSLGRKHALHPKRIGDHMKKHKEFGKNIDTISKAKANRPYNRTHKTRNSQAKLKKSDLLKVSNLRFKEFPLFRSQTKENNTTFDGVSAGSSYTQPDNINATFENNYSQSVSAGDLSETSTAPFGMKYDNNSSVPISTDNQESGEFSRQDVSGITTLQSDISKETFQMEVSGNGTVVVSSGLTLKPFSADGYHENVSLNFQGLDDLESKLLHIFSTPNSSVNATDPDLSSRETREYVEGNGTTPTRDLTMSSHLLEEQREKSSLPSTAEEKSPSNESVKFRKPNDAVSQSPSSFAVHGLSSFATEQNIFGHQTSKDNKTVSPGDEERSESVTNVSYTTVEANGTETTDNLETVSSSLREEQQGQSKSQTTAGNESNSSGSVNFSKISETVSRITGSFAERNTSDFTTDQYSMGDETPKSTVDGSRARRKSNGDGIDNFKAVPSHLQKQRPGKLALLWVTDGESFANETASIRSLNESATDVKAWFAKNGTIQNLSDNITTEHKAEENQTIATNLNENMKNLTVTQSIFAEERLRQSKLTTSNRSVADILPQANVSQPKDSRINFFYFRARRDSYGHATNQHFFNIQTTEDAVSGIQAKKSNGSKYRFDSFDSEGFSGMQSKSTPSSLPPFKIGEESDIKLDDKNDTSESTPSENKSEMPLFQADESLQSKSNDNSSRLGPYISSIPGNGSFTQNFRLGRRLLRIADRSHNKSVVARFRMAKQFRKRRSAKDFPHNTWCIISDRTLYGSLDCTIKTYEKLCVVKCHTNHYINGQTEASFKCSRKKNVWEPKMTSCEEDSQRKAPAPASKPVKNNLDQINEISQPGDNKVDGDKKAAPPKEYEEGQSAEGDSANYGDYEEGNGAPQEQENPPNQDAGGENNPPNQETGGEENAQEYADEGYSQYYE